MTDAWLIRSLSAVLLAGLYASGFLAAAALLKALLHRPPRWLTLQLADSGGRVPDAWLRAFGLSRARPSFREREALLLGCGFGGDAAAYALGRQAVLTALPPAALAVWHYRAGIAALLAGLPPYALLGALAALQTALLWDKPLLAALRRYRSQRIVKEIHAVSSQLLYYAGASLHIHAKLLRCLPYTSVIRADLQRLLGEWYHDAGGAVARFKLRLGTAEGASFAETIETLRLHENEAYYELLRERIGDYKIKIELARESRKESASYVLFALAGIPILYTFQIFIYPWVQEGQKLFQSLNA